MTRIGQLAAWCKTHGNVKLYKIGEATKPSRGTPRMSGAMSCVLTSRVTGPKAWRRSDVAGDDSWIYRLSSEGIEELDAALRVVESKGLRMPQIRKTDFPLPTLQFELSRITDELRVGRGFVLVKGIPVDRYAGQNVSLPLRSRGSIPTRLPKARIFE